MGSDGVALLAPVRGLLAGATAGGRMRLLYEQSSSSSSSVVAPPCIVIGDCSWCVCTTAHAQVAEGFWLARGVYRCGGCARRTLPCRKTGCDAFARGRPGWDEDLCFVHRGVLPRWPTGGEDDRAYAAEVHGRLNPAGRCSWCLRDKRQALEMVTMKGAEVYTCGGCARPTHRCTTCEAGAARTRERRGARDSLTGDRTTLRLIDFQWFRRVFSRLSRF